MSFDRFRAHHWHGLSAGDEAPAIVEAYVEITPLDAVKHEIDTRTGYARVDRPQGSSALPPTLDGFIDRSDEQRHDRLAGRRAAGSMLSAGQGHPPH